MGRNCACAQISLEVRLSVKRNFFEKYAFNSKYCHADIIPFDRILITTLSGFTHILLVTVYNNNILQYDNKYEDITPIFRTNYNTK